MKKIRDLKEDINVVRFNIVDMIFIVVIFSLISIIITTFTIKHNKLNKPSNTIDEAYNQIVNNYYQDVNRDELANSAIDGMMNYLNEKYSVYMNDNQMNILNDELDGTYKGIGVIAEQKKDGIYVYNVFKNSPADKAGMRIGDKLLKVDEIDATTTPLADVVSYIQSHDDISFILSRDNEEVIANVTTTNIDNPVVNSKLLTDDNNNYGYIYLESFSGASSTQFRNALDELEKNDIKGLIIDLRSNKGGYIEQASNIANMFIKEGKKLYSYKEKNKEIDITDTTSEERSYPIVVIVNSTTASSSELLTMALKESYGALTVGVKTYGKGRTQEITKLSDNANIKYTTGLWYSPNHNNIDGVGIKPSYIVDLNKEYYKNPIDKNDNQLAKALSILIKLNK